jgi:hemoglobin
MKLQRLFSNNIVLVVVFGLFLVLTIFKATPVMAHHTKTMAATSIAPTSVEVVTTDNTIAQAQKSLYTRVGGYNALAAVVDDALPRVVTNPKLAKYFIGLSTDSKQRLRQHLVDLFCIASGGPCKYTGRNMVTSHAGLGITGDEFNAFATDVVASLDKFKVPQKEKGELVAIVAGIKKEIVEK